MDIVKLKNLVFEYIRRNDKDEVIEIEKAVDHISLDVKEGEFVAILGHNGSGKSTLARHINGILTPTEGTVWVNGFNTLEEKNLWEVRQAAGMVFQNPDNQIVANVVEEDVGFGPENIGIPTDEIWTRVEQALRRVGMWEMRKKSPNLLSGGQKQRVAIAGVMAMKPRCIILDEATAMLDPVGRKEVMSAVTELNKIEKITIILITHHMEEVIHANRVFVMNHGKIVMEGTPKEVFSQVEQLRELHLGVPQVTELAYECKKKGMPIVDGILTVDEFVSECKRVFQGV